MYIAVDKSTLNSLIYYSFGIALDEDFDVVMEKIIEKAYFDATNQGAFNTKADQRLAVKAKYEDKGSLDIIKERLLKLLDGSVQDYDKWHMDTCDALVARYGECGLKDIFTYGNAQKWVNMAIKYIYILSGISPEEYPESFLKELSHIKKYASELHVPIDSYIIDTMWEAGIQSLPIREGMSVNRNKKYKVPSEYVIGWSNWNREEYIAVHKELKTIYGCTPIEWEADEWIKRAKERRK